MKLLISTLTLLLSLTAAGQSKLLGSWEGTINPGVTLRINFHFSQDSGGGFSTKMDSPDQSAFGIPTDRTFLSADSVYTEISAYSVTFSGRLINDSTIAGTFTQGMEIPLTIKKVQSVQPTVKYQTPVPPYPYNSEEVTFPGGDKDVTIAGTITYPKTPGSPGKYPAILLITGSGPQNRDEEIMGHKPFAVLADHLTKNGFLVLRVDDRGVGKSTGNFAASTSEDFSRDASAAIDFLKSRKETDLKRIGIAGHSEGGIIAPMIAAKRKDINFIILLAAPGIAVSDLMTEQAIAVLNSNGISKTAQEIYKPLYAGITKAIISGKDSSASAKAARNFFLEWVKYKDNQTLSELGLSTPEQQSKYIADMTEALDSPWFRYFMAYNPAPVLKKVKSKVLALNGEKDIQVISSSNLEGLRMGLNHLKSPEPMIIEMPGLNHLFQKCSTCTVAEYGQLAETFSPDAMNLMVEWLKKNVL